MRYLHNFSFFFFFLAFLLFGCTSVSNLEIVENEVDPFVCQKYISTTTLQNRVLEIQTNAITKNCHEVIMQFKDPTTVSFCVDRHQSVDLEILSIEEDMAEIKITHSFDHRSFGLERITKDICTIRINEEGLILS